MSALLSLVMWLMAILGWGGMLLTGTWQGAVAGVLLASGAFIAIVILLGAEPKKPE